MKVTGSRPEQLFAIIYVLATLATFATMVRLGRIVASNVLGGWVAALLLLVATEVLGGVSTLERILTERTVALPLELWVLGTALTGRRLERSMGLLGLAFLIHALSAAYVWMLVSVGALVHPRLGLRKTVTSWFFFMLTASPLLIAKIFASDAPALWGIAEREWIELLRVRSPHHVFPFSWEPSSFVFTVLFFAAPTWWGLRRRSEAMHRMIGGMALATFALWIAGTVFTEMFPSGLALRLQLFRCTRFLIYIALAMNASVLVRRLQGPAHVSRVEVALCATMIPLYFLDSRHILFGALLLVLVLTHVWWRARARRSGTWMLPAAYTMVICAVATNASILQRKPAANPHLHSSQDRGWRDVQLWAREETELDAVFIVPPNWVGFRVESERSIYGDWHDGTYMFFNPSFGHVWNERMEELATLYDGTPLDLARVRRVAHKVATEAVYVVVPPVGNLEPAPGLPTVYRSADRRFSVHRVQ